jgi:hypothetical protein
VHLTQRTIPDGDTARLFPAAPDAGHLPRWLELRRVDATRLTLRQGKAAEQAKVAQAREAGYALVVAAAPEAVAVVTDPDPSPTTRRTRASKRMVTNARDMRNDLLEATRWAKACRL